MNDDKALVVARGRCGDSEDEARARILADWAASGLSARVFALRAGVRMSQLYEWRQRARRRSLVVVGEGRRVGARALRPVSLVELPAIAQGAWVAEVASRAGAVRLSPVADPRWAAALITELNRC